MAYFRIQCSSLSGSLRIPPSKSQTIRAILFASLAKGKSLIHNPLISTDSHAMIEACRNLGAQITIQENCINVEGINGKITHAEDVIQAGNSGLVLRFIAAVAALGSLPIVITGDHSIRHLRPMTALTNSLQQLGAKVISTKGDGFAPIIVQGPISKGKTIINGEDSQPVSALLIASMFAPGPIEIVVRNPGEKPWVMMTLEWLQRLGIVCQHQNFEYYHLNGNSQFSGFEYYVPGDWSSAAFPIAAALITGSELTLTNIDAGDGQGDKQLINALEKMGAKFEWRNDKSILHIGKGQKLNGADIDINDFVDALPVLSAIACFSEGKTRLRNGAIAKQKECNRIQCVAAELRKMGASIEEHDDGLTIHSQGLSGICVSSHNDHRMAMALSVAALGAHGETIVDNVTCVQKTFPSFSKDIISLGANLEEHL